MHDGQMRCSTCKAAAEFCPSSPLAALHTARWTMMKFLYKYAEFFINVCLID